MSGAKLSDIEQCRAEVEAAKVNYETAKARLEMAEQYARLNADAQATAASSPRRKGRR